MILLFWIVGGFVGTVLIVAAIAWGLVILGTLIKGSKDLWS
jgi:hypothetical protein